MELTSRIPTTLKSTSTEPGFSRQRSVNNKPTSVHSRNRRNRLTVMNKQSPNRLDLDHTITRRKFLGTTALSSAALLTGGLTSLLPRSASAAGGFDFLEKSIPELQDAMASGRLSSKGLVIDYLQRINSFNGLLHSVIETNPDAISIAEELDNERRHGHVRGPLHGIPILVKDNIATHDRMQTTAGSFALVGSQVPSDAVIIHLLRDAGVVILGKAKLGVLAYFRLVES